MNYENLTDEQKNKLNDEIKKEYPNSKIDIEDIKIIRDGDILKISYQGINIEIPIGKPDQSTTNNIWSTIVGGVIAISAVAVTLVFNKRQ
ncbi:hypothetical protein N5U18_07400 [Aliarcobacter butzleri]|uniref:hypothetical protein n=1 Tax=Aliarcobacter butzleri TaxID=28197 RepID=UPI0021B1F0C9|nr:hypothetical protein [Aliarcobacter butzleri]MCT7548306.1 hypothetical protein [Aliarcobacter butzleri]